MKPINGFDDVKPAGDFDRLAPGGYVVRITAVEDVPEKEYLKLVYDIAEGEEKGRFSDEWGKDHPYAHQLLRSYKEKALGMFKAFTNAVEASNDGYKWSWSEETLVGKLLGVVLGEEEYNTTDGRVGTRLYVKSCKSAEEIRSGAFTIPELKKLKSDAPAGMQPIAKDDKDPFADLNPSDIPF